MAESNDILLLDLWLKSYAGWLCRNQGQLLLRKVKSFWIHMDDTNIHFCCLNQKPTEATRPLTWGWYIVWCAVYSPAKLVLIAQRDDQAELTWVTGYLSQPCANQSHFHCTKLPPWECEYLYNSLLRELLLYYSGLTDNVCRSSSDWCSRVW